MAGQGRRIWWLCALLAMVAVACGNETIVVSGPSVAADGAAEVSGVDDPEPAPEEPAEDDDAFTLDFDIDPALLDEAEEDGGDQDGGADDDEDASNAPTDPADGDDADDEDAVVIDEAPAGATMLRRAAADTAAAETYRFEVSFGMEVAGAGTSLFVPDTPLTQGAVAGDRSWMMLDMGPIFEAVFEAAGSGTAAALLGDDLSMEILSEGDEEMFVRAPLFAAMANLGALPGAEQLSVLEEGWGRVDLVAAGLSPDELGSLTGAQTGASADALLDLVDQIGGTVTEVGAVDVRGVPTTHYLAEIPLADVLDAQGVTAEDLGGFPVGNAVLPVEIHVDAESRIRRIGVNLDTDLLAELGGGADLTGVTFRVTTVIDFYDFGAQIDIPAGSTLGAVDVTDAFIALANS